MCSRPPPITVIVISCRGKGRVEQVLESIDRQDYNGSLSAMVLGDNPAWSPSDFVMTRGSRIQLVPFAVVMSKDLREAPAVFRVARLRNLGIAMADSEYLCFLDDDNSWEVDHLSRLMDAIQSSGANLAHSWSKIFNADGSPWDGSGFPWGTNSRHSDMVYAQFCREGVLTPGSNVVRDKVTVRLLTESVSGVDMGCWLFSRKFFDQYRFEVDYSEGDLENSVTEDSKLALYVDALRYDVATSNTASLRYCLGGYSNKAASAASIQPKRPGQYSAVSQGISVMVVSRRGLVALKRTLETIEEQTFAGPIQLIVVSDSEREVIDLSQHCRRPKMEISVIAVTGDERFEQRSAVERVSRFRNFVVSLANNPSVCFLDDDNLWHPDHLESLFNCLQDGQYDAAYSWRELVNNDGSPWSGDCFPWTKDEVVGREYIEQLRRCGITTSGSAIFRDCFEAVLGGRGIGTVDMGSWLFRREALLRVPFKTGYSRFEIDEAITEDDKLLHDLRRLSFRVTCTERSTLIYRLGGYSNNNGRG
jgi:glycosyltransferase involved in cell wall biosynthesis